jgi:LysM repeat protein
MQMNNPSPFVPKGSNVEQKNASRGRVRFAVFCILSIHVVGLVALLLTNGCRRHEPEPLPEPEPTNLFSDPVLEPPTGFDAPPAVSNPPPMETQFQPEPPPFEPTPAPVQPLYSNQEYTIVAGDTFSGIADKFPGVTARQIMDANPTVQPTRLRIGQKIQIPPPSINPSASGAVSQPQSTSNGQQIYTVKSGDTLTGIARRNGTTVKALRSENDLVTDKIRVGQKLKIPAKTPAPTPTYETGPSAPTLTPPGQF